MVFTRMDHDEVVADITVIIEAADVAVEVIGAEVATVVAVVVRKGGSDQKVGIEDEVGRGSSVGVVVVSEEG